MQVYKTIAETRTAIQSAKAQGKSIGLVPTMGALHEGHMTLARKARAENDFVITSIFVNPTQFNDPKDLINYPRDDEGDIAKLTALGIDAVFLPSVEEMYPDAITTLVDVPVLTDKLIGKLRPGHFQGMASVVVKLFNIMTPDRAYFGEKDFQQLAIIRRFVSDLNIPLNVIGVPIVREDDGLAMSSRNARLTAQDRNAAPIIYQSIESAREAARNGERDIENLKAVIKSKLETEPSAEPLSIDIMNAGTLEPMETLNAPAVILLNVRFGEIILIDQGDITPNS